MTLELNICVLFCAIIIRVFLFVLYAIGASGVVVSGLSRGTHRVEVEATLDCNPLVKATKVFSVTSPGNIDVPEIVVRREDTGILLASFEVCQTAQYECQVDNGTRGICESPSSEQ